MCRHCLNPALSDRLASGHSRGLYFLAPALRTPQGPRLIQPTGCGTAATWIDRRSTVAEYFRCSNHGHSTFQRVTVRVLPNSPLWDQGCRLRRRAVIRSWSYHGGLGHDTARGPGGPCSVAAQSARRASSTSLAVVCSRVCSYIRTSAMRPPDAADRPTPDERPRAPAVQRSALRTAEPPRSLAACGVPRGHAHHRPDPSNREEPEAVSNPHQHVVSLGLPTFQNFHENRKIVLISRAAQASRTAGGICSASTTNFACPSRGLPHHPISDYLLARPAAAQGRTCALGAQNRPPVRRRPAAPLPYHRPLRARPSIGSSRDTCNCGNESISADDSCCRRSCERSPRPRVSGAELLRSLDRWSDTSCSAS
jgi:hypothetical protein